MEKTKKILRPAEVIDAFVCDKCGESFHPNADDPLERSEANEMLHIRMEGGYGSIFGDGTKIEGDFCQDCVNTLLGIYLRYNPND